MAGGDWTMSVNLSSLQLQTVSMSIQHQILKSQCTGMHFENVSRWIEFHDVGHEKRLCHRVNTNPKVACLHNPKVSGH